MIRLVAVTVVSAAAVVSAADPAGLPAAADALGKLVPLGLDGGRLTLDRDAWEKLREKEPTDPAERKKYRREKVVAKYGKHAEKWDDNTVNIQYEHHIAVPIPQQMFQEVIRLIGGSASFSSASSSWSNNRRSLLEDRGDVAGHLQFETDGKAFSLRIAEKRGAGRVLEVEEDPAFGLTLRLSERTAGRLLLFTQDKAGRVRLMWIDGTAVESAEAGSFTELLAREPAKVDARLFGKLAELGIRPPLSPMMPEVIAQAVSGFSPPPKELAERFDRLLAGLGADDVEVRERSTAELSKLFPSMVQAVCSAAGSAGDPEVKSRLAMVLDAHPRILQARAYVEALKLHRDRAYLERVAAERPEFRDAARARLAQLQDGPRGK